MTSSDPSTQIVSEELLVQLFEEFEVRRIERMEMGAEEYGRQSFLNPQTDLFNMMYEELLDIANYASMMYARLRIKEQALEDSIDSPSQDDAAGTQEGLPFDLGTFTSGQGIPGAS